MSDAVLRYWSRSQSPLRKESRFRQLCREDRDHRRYCSHAPTQPSRTSFFLLRRRTAPARRLTGSIVAEGISVTITIAAPGQDARLTFAGAAGQVISA